MSVFHDLKIQMDSISAMFDEDAFKEIFDFFKVDSNQIDFDYFVNIEVKLVFNYVKFRVYVLGCLLINTDF